MGKQKKSNDSKTILRWMQTSKNTTEQNEKTRQIFVWLFYLKNCLNILLIAFCCAFVIEAIWLFLGSTASTVDEVMVSMGPVFVVFDNSWPEVVMTWILKLTSTLFSPLLLGDLLGDSLMNFQIIDFSTVYKTIMMWYPFPSLKVSIQTKKQTI